MTRYPTLATHPRADFGLWQPLVAGFRLGTATLGGADVTVEEHVFEGGHLWHDAFVERAGAFVDERIAASAADAG